MQPNAAMRTTPPKAPGPFYSQGLRSVVFAKRPTDMMVHVAGHGPRRIYRSDHTGRYYFILARRRVAIDPAVVLRLIRER